MSSVSRHMNMAVWLLFLVAGTALAQPGFVYSASTKSFVTVQPDHAVLGINDFGHIVGISPTDGSLPIHGFIKREHLVTSFDYPGAYDTTPYGINNAGQIAGTQCSWTTSFLPACTGFLKVADRFESFEYPGATFTYANGINNIGQVVGAYRIEVMVGPNTVQDFDHGLVIEGRILTAFDFPGAYSTAASGINDASEIVGSYVELTSQWPGFRYHGFLKAGDTLSSIDYPGAWFTFATGINNLGQVVGRYQDRYGYTHGFLKDGTVFTSFDIPGADTFPSSINNVGQIVGDYYARPVVPAVSDLIGQIRALGLPDGTRASLVAKLNAAIAAFNVGELATTCMRVDDFINHVHAQSGKKITLDQAEGLLDATAQIEVMLGCH